MALRILKKPWQFREVYRKGQKIDGRFAVLFYYEGGEAGTGPVYGFVASRRVGGAVARNRAKRLLREAARQAAVHLRGRDVWIVLVARAELARSRYDDARMEIEKQTKRVAHAGARDDQRNHR